MTFQIGLQLADSGAYDGEDLIPRGRRKGVEAA